MELPRRSLLAGSLLALNADSETVRPKEPDALRVLRNDLAAKDGSALVGFTPAGPEAVARSVQDKARDKISPKDFGAVLDGINDDTAAMQKAVIYAASLEGAVIDMGGGAAYCGALTLPNSRGLTIRNGRINVKGDVTWLTGAPSATSITFFTLANLFFDCSGQTTTRRPCIDWSKITYSTFRDLWFYNVNQGKTICLYAAGDGVVGPYYNVFDTIYGGGHFAGIQIATAADVARTVNNNTMCHLRFTPGAAGRYGVLIGTNNQQNRIHDAVFEDTVGGTGIYDDGICTQITACRFEGLDVSMDFGPSAAGGCDIGNYFDSNAVKRQFASKAVALRHNSLAECDGAGNPEDNILSGGMKIGGGFRLRGNPGFPDDLGTGQGFAYPSGTLGGVYGGWGSTNDITVLNHLGQIVARVPAGTLDWEVAGSASVSDLYVQSRKVIGAQGAAIANPTDAAGTRRAVIAILDRLRAHGLIAT